MGVQQPLVLHLPHLAQHGRAPTPQRSACVARLEHLRELYRCERSPCCTRHAAPAGNCHAAAATAPAAVGGLGAYTGCAAGGHAKCPPPQQPPKRKVCSRGRTVRELSGATDPASPASPAATQADRLPIGIGAAVQLPPMPPACNGDPRPLSHAAVAAAASQCLPRLVEQGTPPPVCSQLAAPPL